jgi:hypothetical protein
MTAQGVDLLSAAPVPRVSSPFRHEADTISGANLADEQRVG